MYVVALVFGESQEKFDYKNECRVWREAAYCWKVFKSYEYISGDKCTVKLKASSKKCSKVNNMSIVQIVNLSQNLKIFS